MIGTGIDVRVKIQDIVSSQLPEYIRSDSPLTDDFLKQFYVSQEFQGGAMDFATNLDQYLDLANLTTEAISGEFFLTQSISEEDSVVFVNSTKSFPNEWGLLKVDDEILTYTGITTNSFTGVIRGFSGITSYTDPSNPAELVFEQTTAASHEIEASVKNLSTLFLKEFYEKIKFTFAPGFENIEVNSEINTGNWIRQARSFYQTKGSEESFEILFRVLYGQDPTVIDLEQFLIKSSDAAYSRRDFSVAIPIEGNPSELKGKTIFQSNDVSVFGAVSEIEPFTRDGRLYYRLYLFVSNDEIKNERKLFTIPGRTKAQRAWKQGDTTITVDTTIGFRDNNEFITQDGTIFKYEERTVNQFLGVTCSDLEKTIAIGDEIIDDITVFGINDKGEEVRLRLTGTLSDISFDEDGVPFTSIGEKIVVDTLGENILPATATRDAQDYADIVANSFIYNTSVRFEVLETNGSTFSINASYLDKSYINEGDFVDFLTRNSQEVLLENRVVNSVDFLNATITVSDTSGLPLNALIDIRRKQNFATSSNTNIDYGNDAVLSNVINLYDAREYDSNFYVATNSLPSYEMDVEVIESVISGITTTNFEEFDKFEDVFNTLVFETPVPFLTGDLIRYTTNSKVTTPICEISEYFVEVLSDPRKIRLFISPSFIGSTNAVGFNGVVSPGDHIFTLATQSGREIRSQRTYRKIPISDTQLLQNITISRTPVEVDPGTVAVLTNGVEILSYKGASKVYLGPIVEVDPVAGGRGYSVTSPPEIIIEDPDLQLVAPTTVGPSTAYVTPVIKGKLEKILIDPQDFDVDKVFSISVVGGNSPGASAIPLIERRRRSVPFDSRIVALGGGIDAEDESILFLNDHKFSLGEEIVYNSKGAQSISIARAGGTNSGSAANVLADGGIYYCEPLNSRTIRIYPTQGDLRAGVNTVGFTSTGNGYGIQSFDTLSKSRITGATIIEDGGDFYYRNMQFRPENVFIEYDEIRYPKHGFNSGELVEYGNTETSIGGLSTSNQYYVEKLTDDSFKLADAGIGGTSKFDYDRKDFVNFTSTGVGTHNVKYPDVVVDIVVSFASTVTGIITATPFIRGEIESTYVDEGGYYGSDILNFQKNPKVTTVRGEGARLTPVVVEGEIISILILSKGINYPDSPDVIVTDPEGGGQGAVLRAIVVDGSIEEVLILSPGLGYKQETTKTTVVDPADGAILTPRIRDLSVNLQERFGFQSLIDNNYAIVSYDRTIRENVYNDVGFTHSPIIGWANDGNPIYGGFALDDPENFNSGFRAMKTAYELDPSIIEGRPSEFLYPSGFFVEDFKYVDNGDLDEYNGRYCRTPEFPNGVYAYFAGISTDAQSLEREPQFPYFVGPKFRDAPIRSRSGDVDQDFNINDKPIYRNTQPYAVGNPFMGSEFLDQSYLFDTQEAIIDTIKQGGVDGIDIIGAGVSYSIGEIAVFDQEQDNLSVVISEITGKEVLSVINEKLEYTKDVTKIVRKDKTTVSVYVDPKHDYLDDDSVVFSGLTTSLESLGGTKRIAVDNSFMTLFSPMEANQFPGYTDIFVNSLTDNISVGSSLVVGFGLTTEGCEIINIFPINKALRVLRPLGLGISFGIGAQLNVIPDRFDVSVTLPEFESQLDEVYYFNPLQTVGFGTRGADGKSFGTVYSIGNINYNLDIPVGRIFAPDHGFVGVEPAIFSIGDEDDDRLVIDDGTTISPLPSTGTTEQLIFVERLSRDYIGIRTSADGNNVFIPGGGEDLPTYSIRTTRYSEGANIARLDAVVTTATPHELENGDAITMRILPTGDSGVGTDKEVTLLFDEISQSLITNPRNVEPVGIDTVANIINIESHNFVLGDYVLYTSVGIESVGGLELHQKYYVVPFDSNRFQLAETFEDIKPGSELIIDLTSVGVSTHTFSLVNPKIAVTKNNNIKFDVSDPSLLGYELKFFYDQTLTEIFESNGIDDEFPIVGVGTLGLEDGVRTINYSPNNPTAIYYGVEKGGYISTADTDTINNNTVVLIESNYNISNRIVNVGLNTFKYSLYNNPESTEYFAIDADIQYKTSSRNALGGVANTRIISSGDNFSDLPEFITINSEFGSAATLRAKSDSIGKLANFNIQNPGWSYSADNTLNPKGIIQSKIEFGDSDFITSIDILSSGSGYQNAPNSVLVDAVTRQVIESGSIEFAVQNSGISEVIIDVAPSGLSKNRHELFTTNNSNGIPILTINSIDQNVGVVTFGIQTPILGYATKPFEVGDRVFIENIISEFGEFANMNSEDYGYSFFQVVDEGIEDGRIFIGVKYPEEAIDNIGVAVTFQGAFSSVVNKNIYPEFTVNQNTAILIVGERVSIIDELGNAADTDLVVEQSNTNFFKVRGGYDILPGDVLKGNVSGITVTITAIDSSECRFEIGAVSRISTGWNNQTGFLNEEYQVTPDNDYYQNLSYSIKSEVTFEEMIGPINRLVHPAGLKNFADVKLESSAGIAFTSSTGTSITVDLIGLTDVELTPLRVDRINNFDLGYDQNVRDNITNAIRFNSRTPNKRLTDYIEVRTNRVLLHDDISNEFIDADNVRSQKEYIDFNVINSLYTRGLLQVRNPFTDQVELTEIIALTYDNNAFTLQKAIVSDNEKGYGTFEAIALPSTEYTMRYTSDDQEEFDVDLKLFTNSFTFEDESFKQIGNAQLGGLERSIESGSQAIVFTASSEQIEAISLQVTLIDSRDQASYVEIYAFRIRDDAFQAIYGFSGNTLKNVNEDFVGEFNVKVDSVSGADVLLVEYQNTSDGTILLTTKSTEFSETTLGSTPYRFKRGNIPAGTERSLILDSLRNVGPVTSPIELARYDSGLFQSVRSLVYLRNDTFATIQQVMFVNSAGSTYTNEYPFITEGDGIPGPGIGTFGAEVVGPDMVLFFYPDTNLAGGNISANVYNETIYRDLDSLNYRNIPLVYAQSEETYFIDRFIAPLGQRTNNVRFPLRYEGIPIYQKTIDPATDLIDIGSNGFNVIDSPDHFFSTGERLFYTPESSVKELASEAIDIQSINIPGIGITTKMPNVVYAIKRDLNRFSVAGTYDDAINRDALIITGIGSGNAHTFEMSQKLEKTVITIDGVLQSPITSSNKVYTLDETIDETEELLTLAGIGTISVGDLLLVGGTEFVKIDNVGFGTGTEGPINNTGTTPLIRVERGVVGSIATSHTQGASMDLYRGSYNLVASDIIFTEAPSGKGALTVNENNLVEFNSSFQGRTFLQREYDKIAVFDDISDKFDGETSAFTLTSAGSTINEIENGSGLLLINDIYQTPTTDNNEGNNYEYAYNPVAGINSVIFTGITSENGDQVLSEFDVNQNQIPRGGLIVSLGSTPGLGYAPLYGASIEAEVSGGAITGIITENQIGVTTDIKYADYDNETGEMVVTAYGEPTTAKINIGVATYQNISGQLLIESPVSLSSINLDEGDVVVIEGLEFDCAGLSTESIPVVNAPYDHVSGIVTVTLSSPHNSEIGERIVLTGLNYVCNSYQLNAVDIIDAPYDDVTGIVTITTAIPHTLVPSDTVQLRGLEYECNGTSLETFNVLDVLYDYTTGITTVTLDGAHGSRTGWRIQLSDIEFDCDGASLRTLDVTDAPYDSTTGLATVTFFGNHLASVGERMQLSGIEYECEGTSFVTLNVVDAPYNATTGRAIIDLDAPHNQVVGSRVQLSGIEYECAGTSLSTLNVFNAQYDNTSGITTLTFLANHDSEVGDRIQLSGLEFDCPDSLDIFNVLGAGYNNATGILTVRCSTSNANLFVGRKVRLENIDFRCAVGPELKTYPVNPDFEYDVLTVIDATTFEINVGYSTRSSSIIAAEFDTDSGITTITIDNPDKSIIAGEQVRIDSLVFDDSYTGTNRFYDITNVVDSTTFEISNESSYVSAGVVTADYDNLTGIVEIILTQDAVDSVSVGSSVLLTNFKWVCSQPGISTYPVTPSSFEVLSVTGVGGTIITVGAGTTSEPHFYYGSGQVDINYYAPTFISGAVTLGYEENIFQYDSQATAKLGFTTTTYPDGINGYEFEVIEVLANNRLAVNVGPSSITHNYVSGGIGTVGFTTNFFPDGTYGYEFEILSVPSTTQLEVSVGAIPGIVHNYVSGGIATVGLTTNFFPDGTNGYEFEILDINSPNTLTINVGSIPGITHTYVTGGIGTVGFTTDNYPDGTNGYEFEILETPSLNTLVVNTGAAPYPHTYVSGGIGTVGITTTVFPDGTNGYQFVVLSVGSATEFTVNVGAIGGIEHTYVGAGTAFVGFTTTIFPDGTNGYEFEITDILGSRVFACNVGPSPFPHEYDFGGEATVGFNTSIFPDKDPAYEVVSIVNDNIFSIDVGSIIRIPHTYIGGGTFQRHEPFFFGADGQQPEFVYLNRIEFSCPSPEGGGYDRSLKVVEAPYDETTGIVTIKTSGQHKRVAGNLVTLRDLQYDCAGTSETTLNVTNVIYDDLSGISTITFDAAHGSENGYFLQLSGIEFDCAGTSLTTLTVLDAPYDNTTGIVTVLFDGEHKTSTGQTVQLTGLGYTCNNTSLTELGIVTANYANLSGVVTLEVDGAHGRLSGDKIRLEDLTFSCDSGGLPGSNVFPRPEVEGTEFEVTNVISPTELQINVGGNVFAHEYEFGGSMFVGITSTIFPSGNDGYEFTVLTTPDENTITIGVGTLPFGQEYVTGGIGTCGITTTFFPDGTNGYRFEILDTPSLTTLVVNTGAAPGIQHTYVSGGIGTVGFTTSYFPDGTNGYEFPIQTVLDSFTVELNVGPVPGIVHTYVDGGTMSVGLNTDFFPDKAEAFPFVFLDDAAHFRVLVGRSEFDHTYVDGGTIGQYSMNNVGSGYNFPVVSIGITEKGHVGTAASIIAIPGPGGELTNFTILDPGSGYTNPYIWAPDPNYANLPVTGVFRRSTGFGTETGNNLFITCEVGASKTTAIGRSEFFEVSNFELSNQGFGFLPGDVVEVVGLVTDKRLSAPIEPFQVTILETFTDNFSAWNFGELDYIDSVKRLQDGDRTRFPLIYKGEPFSFEQNPADEESSAIDLDSILLIFVNTVLQVPGLNYTFDGGTSFDFARAPFKEDDIDIYFYRGKRNVDSRIVTEVDESIRPGDELQIKKNDALEDTKTQNIRTVTEIASSDTVRTNLYFGNNDIEEVKPREVAWDKQKRDIFIYGEVAPKTRDSLEPIIRPNSSIIASVDKAATEIFVDNSFLFEYESEVLSDVVLRGLTGRMYKKLSSFETASLEAVVDPDGFISSVNIIDPGLGYPPGGAGVIVYIDPPPGVSAPPDDPRRCQLLVIFNAAGSVLNAAILNRGSGYLPEKPPLITVVEPPLTEGSSLTNTGDYEDIESIEIVEGFSGIITGIQRTNGSSPVIGNGIRFFYKTDSDQGNLNALQPGYFVVVGGTSVGLGVTAIFNSAANQVGSGRSFIDSVYQIWDHVPFSRVGYFDVDTLPLSDPAIDILGANVGHFSWGRIANITRDIETSIDIPVGNQLFTPDMANYPTIIRTAEGLRNEGGISKRG
jgi:hypothetical protein